jgi:outer membrane protein assembly factor BamB
MVYVGGIDGFLYAYGARCATGGATCAPRWKGAIHEISFAPPAVAGGTVYVTTQFGRMFAFPTSCRFGDGTCKRLWQAKMPSQIYSSPAVTDTTVIIGSGRRLFAFNVGCRNDGGLCGPIWKSVRTGPGGGFASSPAVANGIVFVGSQEAYQSNGKLLAYKANCGTGGAICHPIWQSPMLGGMVNSSPAVSHGMVFVSSNSGRSYAFGLP